MGSSARLSGTPLKVSGAWMPMWISLSVTPVVSPPLGETTGPPPPLIDEPGDAGAPGAPAAGAPGAPAGAPSAGVVSPGAPTAAAPAVPALVPGRAVPAASL